MIVASVDHAQTEKRTATTVRGKLLALLSPSTH